MAYPNSDRGNDLIRRHRRVSGLLVMVLVLSFIGGSPALAADGEMISGDTDMASHAMSNGQKKVRVIFDTGSILSDCPIGLSGCSIEYKWRSKKDSCVLFCFWSDDTSWIHLPAGATVLTHCKAKVNFQFELQTRLRWTATTNKTVEFYGKQERQYEIGVSTLLYKLIASALFNATNNTGFTTSYKLETKSGTSAFSAPHTIATSGASYIETDC